MAAALGWPKTSELPRLEGFNEPWERLLFQAREVPLGATLKEAGIADGAKARCTIPKFPADLVFPYVAACMLVRLQHR